MKKNIESITLNSSFIHGLLKSLNKLDKDLEIKDEFKMALTHLMDGTSSSLMLEINDTETSIPMENKITAGKLTLIMHSRRVIMDGRDISLTPKEYDILYFLIRNQGQVFSKEQIYHAVWSADYILDDSNIMSFIRKLRKKIEPNPDDPQYILTVWGIGYKFNEQLS